MSKFFSAETAALVLIDYQVGTLQLCRSMSSDLALRNAVELAKVATILKIPIVLTSSQEDQVQGPTAPALAQAAPEAFKNRIKRAGTVNAWDDPNFKKAIEATGRKQLIMGGITTDICLVFPAISAVEDGYEVHAIVDASGSPLQVSDDMARSRMEKNGVTLTVTNTTIAELTKNWASKEGPALVSIMFQGVLPIVAA